MKKSHLLFFAIILFGCIMLPGCVDKEKIKEEIKAEMEKQKLQEENEQLRALLDSKNQQEPAETKVEEVKEVKVKPVQEVSVPNYVQIHDADNAGVVLRTRPSDSTKLKGSGNPHFFTGYVFECVGISGHYYKVYFEGDYYFIPKKYAYPHNGGGVGGPMSY